MQRIRKLAPMDPKCMHQCDGLDIYGYEMEEVILPILHGKKNVKAIRVVVHGRNFIAAAQPLSVKIGKQSLKFLRIAPGGRGVEGILMADPERDARIKIQMGDQDAVESFHKVQPDQVRRLGGGDD